MIRKIFKFSLKAFVFYLILIIGLIVFVSLSGNKSSEKQSVKDVTEEKINVYATIESNNPLLRANVTLKPVKSGSGEKIGDYADILFTTDLWNMVTSDYLQEFYSTRMKSFQTNWTCIRFENATGIVFASNDIVGSYGRLSNDGMIADVVKYVKIGDKEVLKVD